MSLVPYSIDGCPVVHPRRSGRSGEHLGRVPLDLSDRIEAASSRDPTGVGDPGGRDHAPRPCCRSACTRGRRCGGGRRTDGHRVRAHPGISMWKRMKQAPRELPVLVRALVTLQTDLHAAGSPEGLPPMVSRVHDKIDAARQLSPDDRALAHDLLRHLPTPTALCHGDMHPANILMSPRGWMVVDWFGAASGHPTADHARSSLLMRPTTAARPDSSFLGGATRAVLTRLHRTYLQTLDQRGLDGGGTSPRGRQSWLRPDWRSPSRPTTSSVSGRHTRRHWGRRRSSRASTSSTEAQRTPGMSALRRG